MPDASFVPSFGQQRLWFLDQLEPGTAAYNLARAFSIVGPLDVGVLQRALQTIVLRHASLRTVFDSVNGECRQVVLPDINTDIPVHDLSETVESNRDAEAVEIISAEAKEPFDLSEGPLLRCRLVRLGPELLVPVERERVGGQGRGVQGLRGLALRPRRREQRLVEQDRLEPLAIDGQECDGAERGAGAR